MFVHDLCNSQIEYLSNSLDFNRKVRAACRITAEGDLWGRSSESEAPSLKRYHSASGGSIFNLHFRLARVGDILKFQGIGLFFLNPAETGAELR